jgi:hypothetical protein
MYLSKIFSLQSDWYILIYIIKYTICLLLHLVSVGILGVFILDFIIFVDEHSINACVVEW